MLSLQLWYLLHNTQWQEQQQRKQRQTQQQTIHADPCERQTALLRIMLHPLICHLRSLGAFCNWICLCRNLRPLINPMHAKCRPISCWSHCGFQGWRCSLSTSKVPQLPSDPFAYVASVQKKQAHMPCCWKLQTGAWKCIQKSVCLPELQENNRLLFGTILHLHLRQLRRSRPTATAACHCALLLHHHATFSSMLTCA